jgi:RNA polymerase sigma factor (sigma-70 family)
MNFIRFKFIIKKKHPQPTNPPYLSVFKFKSSNEYVTLNNLTAVIEGCRRNDRYAQHQLYEAFFDYVYGIARRYSTSETEAEEWTQDVFFKVFSKIEQYNTAFPFPSWLKKVAINACIDRYRVQIKNTATVELNYADNFEDVVAVLVDMDVDFLLHLVRQLPPSYRVSFNLLAIEGLQYQEIADEMRISIGSVKSNISKARQLLKEMIF